MGREAPGAPPTLLEKLVRSQKSTSGELGSSSRQGTGGDSFSPERHWFRIRATVSCLSCGVDALMASLLGRDEWSDNVGERGAVKL
jgi:hypothetical protein